MNLQYRGSKKYNHRLHLYNIIDPSKDIGVLPKFIRIRLDTRATGKINCTGQSNYKVNCPRKVANPVGVLGEHDRADQEPTP